MIRCLVSGATGLIGRHAVAALCAAGVDVHAVTRGQADGAPGQGKELGLDLINWHCGDVLDEDFIRGLCTDVKATHLLHLAWSTEHGRFWDDPENETWRLASMRLIKAFQQVGGQRAVVAGTCAEYDWTQLGDGRCREGVTPIAPHTLYGHMKAETLDWLETFAAAHAMSYAWGRVFFLYGLGEDPKRLIPAVAGALARGQEARCSSGTQIRDFLDARDVGGAFAQLLLSDVQGPVNIASGQGISVGEVVKMIADQIGRADLLRLGALPDREGEPAVLVGDVTRLREELGYVPKISLKDGLAEVCARYLKGKA